MGSGTCVCSVTFDNGVCQDFQMSYFIIVKYNEFVQTRDDIFCQKFLTYFKQERQIFGVKTLILCSSGSRGKI